MARGPKKHLKRLAAPSSWMLDKLSGIFAPRPTAGPHKLRESLPLQLVIRERLKYALSGSEAVSLIKQRKVKVDGKVRTDVKYPVGHMDVIEIPEVKQHYRVLYDAKGRMTLLPLTGADAGLKLLKVRKLMYAPGRVPIATCHDGRVIRYPDPLLKKNDTVVWDIEAGAPHDWIRFKLGRLAVVTGGANTGRIGTITKVERHPGSFHIVHLKDAAGHEFATRIGNVFVIGREESVIQVPRDHGIRAGLVADRDARIEAYRVNKLPGKKKAKKQK